MAETHRVGVIGGGSWATAIIKLLLNNCEKVNWYIRRPEVVDYIRKNRHNPNYLTSLLIDTAKINFYSDINEAVTNSDILIFAIPSAFLKDSLISFSLPLKDKIIFSAIKGIIPKDNITIADFFHKYYNVPLSSMGVIAGPCHAEEIALERLSYLTLGAENSRVAKLLSEKIECRYVKTRFAKDIYGTEYASVLKNIFAIAAGICIGIGYGDNFQAVLVSNCIREMKRFLEKITPSANRKINSSAYLGDLLVTAYSQFSRNRTFGAMIGKGYSVKSAMMEMNMIAEGYYATSCIYEINKNYNIKMPIVYAVYNILYEKISPAIEIKLLTEKLK
ncbi:MAG: NAD(P)-binding domain-containing protein [Bacteroidia bacterium]|nr:NAD(P)-binding domain-containing protein [Bacteroidia bacterium]